MVKHRRGRPFANGARHKSAKLTAGIVTQLRKTAKRYLKRRAFPYGWLKRNARRLRVSSPSLSFAVRGITWKHLRERGVRTLRP